MELHCKEEEGIYRIVKGKNSGMKMHKKTPVF